LIFIIGGNGLVGSAIVNYVNKKNIAYKIIQRENKEDFFGQSCDTLIFANGNALKYKANTDHFFDFLASVSSIAEYIHKINFKKFIHISTIDVYEKKSDLNSTKEDTVINDSNLDTYGFHKLLAENYVKKYCSDYLIFRLPGLVGKGLKKNPVYDFIQPEKKVMISPNSVLNFINTDIIAELIFQISNLGIKNEIFNLASKNSIKISDMKKIIGIDSKYTSDANQNIQHYEINTEKIQKYVKLSKSEEAIKTYFETLKIN
jgi:nucleoside-diphosphate-sugar epimerase